MFRKFLLTFILLTILLPISMHVSYTNSRPIRVSERIIDDVRLYVIPSKISDLTPVWILAYIKGKYNINPSLKITSKIGVKMGLNVKPSIKTSEGPISLKITVYLNNSRVNNAYVELIRPLTQKVIASGFTAADGSITFSLDLNLLNSVIVTRTYYDMDRDKLYEYYNRTSVIIDSKNVEVDVVLNKIIDVLKFTSLLPQPIVQEFSFRPIGNNWFIAGVPGLPYRMINITAPDPLPSLLLTIIVKGYTNCSIMVDSEVYNLFLEVNSTEIREKVPPLALAYVSNSLYDLNIYKETLGLAPKGWSVAEFTPLDISIIAMDDEGYEGIKELAFEYSVNNGTWSEGYVESDSVMNYLSTIVQNINQMIGQVNEILRRLGIERRIPESGLPLFIGKSEIPGLSAGSYVRFRVRVVDKHNNSFTSPMGLYYVYNRTGEPILIIDPNVKLWVIKENLVQLLNTIRGGIDLSLPGDYIEGFRNVSRVAEVLHKSFVVFHNWQYLSERYNITIVWPGKGIGNYLNTVKPEVIVLSNLYLGLNMTDTFNWDLYDISCNGESALECILNYVRRNHAGLIATHGTLSDWILWTSEEFKIKIGTRGHIGNDIEDIISDKRLASSLGLIWLPLWEYVRDEVAKALLEVSKPAGLAVGSTPLQIPYTPWDGILKLTHEGKLINWTIPEEPIIIPNPYKGVNVKYRAYTQVGWQLGAPRAIAYAALNSTRSIRGLIKNFYHKIYEIIENATAKSLRQKLEGQLERALAHGVKDLRGGLAKARIIKNNILTEFWIPELKDKIRINITIPSNVYNRIMQLMPLKIVALSPNGTAGITAFDVYWDSNSGYRAVYFSFEVEASITESGRSLLQEAVKWVREWRYVDISRLLNGKMRAPKEVVERFEEIIKGIKGTPLYDDPALLPEEGVYNLTLSVNKPINVTVVIAHPWSGKVNATVISENVIVLNVTRYDNITQVNIYVEKAGNVTINISSDPTSTFDQTYLYASTVEVAEKTVTITTTVTTTVTSPITTTVTTTEITTTTLTETATRTVTKVKTAVETTTVTTTAPPSLTTITKTETHTTTSVKTVTETEKATATITRTSTITKEAYTISMMISASLIAVIIILLSIIIRMRR